MFEKCYINKVYHHYYYSNWSRDTVRLTYKPPRLRSSATITPNKWHKVNLLSYVHQTSHCKRVAGVKLIKRMDPCNLSQYRVNKSGLWQVYWAYSFREAAVLTDKTWLQRSAAKCRNANPRTSDIQNGHKWRGAAAWRAEISLSISVYRQNHSCGRTQNVINSQAACFHFLCFISPQWNISQSQMIILAAGFSNSVWWTELKVALIICNCLRRCDIFTSYEYMGVSCL